MRLPAWLRSFFGRITLPGCQTGKVQRSAPAEVQPSAPAPERKPSFSRIRVRADQLRPGDILKGREVVDILPGLKKTDSGIQQCVYVALAGQMARSEFPSGIALDVDRDSSLFKG